MYKYIVKDDEKSVFDQVARLFCFRVDVNRDLFIEQTELENWIVLKVNEHFDEAAAENDKVFQMIDTDGDGVYYNVTVINSC